QLNRAEIGKQQNIGRNLAHLIRTRKRRVRDGGALRPQTHRHAAFLRGGGKIAIDAFRFGSAAGHGRDEQRRAEGLAEQGKSGINGVEVHYGQRLMRKAILFQPGADVKKLHILFEVDAQVFDFAIAKNGFVGHKASRIQFADYITTNTLRRIFPHSRAQLGGKRGVYANGASFKTLTLTGIPHILARTLNLKPPHDGGAIWQIRISNLKLWQLSPTSWAWTSRKSFSKRAFAKICKPIRSIS